ncbi:MAG: hypothetical protein R3Y53_08310 [Bacillota bacterium]
MKMRRICILSFCLGILSTGCSADGIATALAKNEETVREEFVASDSQSENPMEDMWRLSICETIESMEQVEGAEIIVDDETSEIQVNISLLDDQLSDEEVATLMDFISGSTNLSYEIVVVQV